MIQFPSSIDREVASSLLLLSSGKSFFSSSSDRSGSGRKIISMGEGNLSLSFVSTETRSCESALSNTGSSLKSYDTDFMNFKIAKKRRTNVTYSSVDSKPNQECDTISKCSSDSKEESCFSTGSSEITSIESRITEIMSREKTNRESKKRESHSSTSIRRRAVEIMEFLSTNSSSSEVKIRQVLGDSADTSKALRMLLKMGSVKRSGAGGKQEPFVYKIA